MPTKNADKLFPVVQKVTASRAMTAASADLSLVEQTQTHILLNELKKRIEARLKTLRDPLFLAATTKGELSETGSSKTLNVDGNQVAAITTVASSPDDTALKALLGKKGIPTDQAYDSITVYQLNPSRLKYLIEIGKLTEDEVSALCKRGDMLKVTASREFKEMLESLDSTEGRETAELVMEAKKSKRR